MQRRFFSNPNFEHKERRGRGGYGRPYPVVSTQIQQRVEDNIRMTLSQTPQFRPVVFGPPMTPMGLLPNPLPNTPLPNMISPHHTPSSSSSTPNRKRRHQSTPQSNDNADHGKRTRTSVGGTPKSPENTYASLSDEIFTYAQQHQQSDNLLERKLRLRSVLLSLFRRQFPAASLHLVGSSCNGFATDNSDADFCLMLTHSRNIDQRFEAQFYLKALQKLLRGVPSVKQLLLIRAKVPILKFKDTISGCECDVNINNATGIRNTHLLRTYSKVDDRVRPMVLAVKRWAKSRKINDASQGTLSSYSLVLMVLHYLQSSCHPPVIKSLQEHFPEFFTTGIHVDQLPLFDPASSIPCNGSENKQCLGELLAGFFKYFGNEFKWDYFVISIRLGRAMPKDLDEQYRNKYICIEEPFDRTNTARAVHEYSRYAQIKQEFKRAHNKIKERFSFGDIL